MANRNAPFGLRAYRHLTGGIVRAAKYSMASGLAANIGYGDPVVETGTSDAAGRARITKSAVDGAQSGVFGGCFYRNSIGDVVFSKNWVSGTTTFGSEEATALVYDDPNIVFIAQMSLGLAAANIGLLADLSDSSGPNSLGVSTASVDSADLAGSAVKILGIVERPDNALGNYAVVEVLLANHVRHERPAV